MLTLSWFITPHGEAIFAAGVNYPLKVAGFDLALTGWFCPAADSLEHAVDRGEGSKEQALLPRGDRQNAMGQIHILLTLGHREDARGLRWPQPMQRLPRTRRGVGQAQSLPDMRLPAHDPAMGDRQERTAAPGRHAGGLGGRDHEEDSLLDGRRDPVAGYRSHEPPFVFFRKMASSTVRSASARSLSWSSALSVS